MDWHNLFQALLSLIFVIGLLLLTVYLFKICELKGRGCKLVKNLGANSRLEILERIRLDQKSAVLLLRCDRKEHLLLLSDGSVLELDHPTPKPEPEPHTDD